VVGCQFYPYVLKNYDEILFAAVFGSGLLCYDQRMHICIFFYILVFSHIHLADFLRILESKIQVCVGGKLLGIEGCSQYFALSTRPGRAEPTFSTDCLQRSLH